MVLPSLQHLKARLSPEIRNSEQAPRLENLKATLKSAYRLAKENARKSHATNKRYYDRKARDRNFAVGEYVYLYSPAIKVGLSAKFRQPWTGPWRITARISHLNYTLVNERGREVTVHVNRIKPCYKVPDWPAEANPPKKVQPKRRREPEEEEPEVLSPGPIPSHAPLVENRQPVRGSPPRDNRFLDTPIPGTPPREAPSNHRVDPTYAPSDTPRSRRELCSNRDDPPLTRLRSRQQNLAEIPEIGGQE